MPLVLHWLDRLRPETRAQVGDKALQLGQLHQRAYPVLPGFAVAAGVLHEFLARHNLTLPDLTALPSDRPQSLQASARQLRQALLAAEFPADWLPPLSAACQTLASPALLCRPSFALGRNLAPAQLLQAQWCWSQPSALARALKQVWAELFRARNLYYWQRAGLSWEHIQLAILIQPARTAIASGTVTRNGKTWQIQALRGLGLSQNRGEALSDLYQIAIADGQLQHHQRGHQSYVYRLHETALAAVDCFERIALDERERQREILTVAHFPQFWSLAQRLATELVSDCDWEWLLVMNGSEPALHLTQVGSHQQLAPLLPIAPSSHRSLVGIGAAPGRAIAPVCLLAGSSKHWQPVPAQSILVIDRITPDWLPLLENAAGLIVEQGGTTSHGAIVARELGIPAVVGLAQATRHLHHGEQIAIDGTRGEVRLLGADATAVARPDPLAGLPAARSRRIEPAEPPADTPVALNTQLWVNLSQPSAIAEAAILPVRGVGLLRAELMMLSLLRARDLKWWLQNPATLSERLAALIERFAQAFAPRPVFYRSTDWRSPEFPLLPGTRAAVNPLLGVRGTYSYQVCPELFAAELAALQRVQQTCDNLNLILPFVRSVEEFERARDRVGKVGLLAVPKFQLWFAAEVPSALFLLPEYVRAGAQGMAIGSNDLTQLLLGADRDDPDLSQTFTDNHPVVWQALRQLIGSAQSAGIPCSVCGQAPVKWPALVDSLVTWGVTAISVEPTAVLAMYRAIAAAEQHQHPAS